MAPELKRIIEAILFAASRPLAVHDLAAWIPEAAPAEIEAALADLAREYDRQDHGFHLQCVSAGFQFRTRPEYGVYIGRMLKNPPARLSRAAMETLAVICYRQPSMKHEIDRVRGVDSAAILRSLLEKNLIRIVGRKNLPGRPLLYGTTRRFLEVFELNDLDSLPKFKELKELISEQARNAYTAQDQAGAPQVGPARLPFPVSAGDPEPPEAQ